MNGCESWTIKKAKCWTIDAFKLWCWGRLLRITSTARRSNQSILNEINCEYSLEGLMLKLKLQYFSHPMQTASSLEEILMLGKTEDKRRRGWQWMRWWDNISNSMDMSLSKLQEIVEDRGTWGLQSMSLARLSDWATTTETLPILFPLHGAPFAFMSNNPKPAILWAHLK